MRSNRILSRTLLLLLTIVSCRSFGQMKPNLVFEGKVIPFDDKFVRVPTAEEKTAFLKAATDPLDLAIKQNIKEIGKVNLAELKEQMKEVDILVVKPGAQAIGSGQFTIRMGNVYVPSTKTIYINTETLNTNPLGGLKLLPHEFAGALGYEDEKHELTTVIMSKNAKIVADAINKRNLDLSKRSTRSEKKNMTNRATSGGVTVIGGGGDDILFEAKVYMIDNYPKWKDWFLNHYIKESDYLDKAQAKGVDLRSIMSEEVLEDYLVYFTSVGFEHMPSDLRQTDEPIKSPSDIEKIMNVYENEFSKGFVRMSREHWNMPIGSYTLEQSHTMISVTLHTVLFGGYILQRYRK